MLAQKGEHKKRNGPPLLWRPRMMKQHHSDIPAASSASRPWSVPRASLIFSLQTKDSQRTLRLPHSRPSPGDIQHFNIPLKGITIVTPATFCYAIFGICNI